jgi:hypothetical protein
MTSPNSFAPFYGLGFVVTLEAASFGAGFAGAPDFDGSAGAGAGLEESGFTGGVATG